MKQRWIFGAVALVVVVIVAFQVGKSPNKAFSEISDSQVRANSATSSDVEAVDKNTDEIRQAQALPDLPEKPADPEFQKWIAEEAKAVNYDHVDNKKKASQIGRVVNSLTPTQAKQLLHTARNPGSSAGEKILSTYLMVEAGLNSRKELLAFINDPMPVQGEVHSVEEVNGVREKSLRIMALDGLFSQVQRDPSQRPALEREIASIQDPYIRAYAQKKWNELQQSENR